MRIFSQPALSLLLAGFAILSLVFAIDCFTPSGMAVWSGYALPVLIFSISLESRKALLLVGIATILLWTGAFLPIATQGISWTAVFVNRSIMSIVFLSIYYVAKRKKETEDRLNLIRDELEQRNRQLEASNAELESFSYSVSHDLRTPLRAIDGFSKILIDDYGSRIPAEALRHLEIVRQGTTQMGQLIDDLLAFSRLSRQQMKTSAFDMKGVAEETLAMLKPEMESRDIQVEIKPMPEAWGDPALIRHVMMNLLSNAIKFTSKKDVARIEVGVQDHGDEVVYYVQDNGVGFEMKYAAKAFGVFQRLHHREDYSGTGVGLAIVQRIISRHGGRIWAEAEPEKGATFFFTLGRNRSQASP